MTSQSSGSDNTVDPQRDQQRKALADTVFKPDPLAGSLNYSYPLNVPPGRNGLQPDLSLSYSSQPGSDVNTVGYAWSFSIPSISRINRNGVNNLYGGQDYFYSSLDGELASSSPGVYGALSEKGNFLKYVYSTSTNSWTVTDKKGTVYTFGSTTASRLDNPNNANQIYEWKLDSVRDANNNYIKYTYYKDAGEIYPSTILYTGNGSTDGPLEVDFLRTSRSDVRSSAQTGFLVTSNYLINEIDMKVSGDWVRKYTLSYTAGDNGARSLLGSITEAGKDGQGTVTTLPATSFSYQQSNPGWTATSTNWNLPVTLVDYNYAPSRGDIGTRILDVNGDGLPDTVQSITNNGVLSSVAYLNTGNGWSARFYYVEPSPNIHRLQSNAIERRCWCSNARSQWRRSA